MLPLYLQIKACCSYSFVMVLILVVLGIRKLKVSHVFTLIRKRECEQQAFMQKVHLSTFLLRVTSKFIFKVRAEVLLANNKCFFFLFKFQNPSKTRLSWLYQDLCSSSSLPIITYNFSFFQANVFTCCLGYWEPDILLNWRALNCSEIS